MNRMTILRLLLPSALVALCLSTLLATSPRRDDSTITGTVVSADNRTLLLASLNTVDVVEMNVASDARITRNGRSADLFELQNGDVATVRVEWRRPVALAKEIDAHSPY